MRGGKEGIKGAQTRKGEGDYPRLGEVEKPVLSKTLVQGKNRPFVSENSTTHHNTRIPQARQFSSTLDDTFPPLPEAPHMPQACPVSAFFLHAQKPSLGVGQSTS